MSSATSIYRTNIDGQAKLSNEESRERLVRWRATGDKRALDAVVCAHYGLVLHFAKRVKRASPPHVDEADLVQEALEGLWFGLQRYDPSRGVKISTYVSWWIRASLNRYMIAAHRTTTLSTRQADRVFWRGRRLRIEREAKQLPTDSETMAGLLGIRRDTYEIVTMWMAAKEVSLAAPLWDDGDGTSTTVGDHMPSSDPCHVDVLGDRDLVTKVDLVARAYAAPLKPFPRDVFVGRVWTHDDVLPTLDEIGRRWGRTRERVRQVERGVRDGFRRAVDQAGLLDTIGDLAHE